MPHAELLGVVVPEFITTEWRVKNDNFPIIGRKLGRAELIKCDEVGAGK
jgi:hypothetical protein